MGAISGDTRPPHHLDDVVVLHWMKESDQLMHAHTGVAVPALCGAWVTPDEQLTASVGEGDVGCRYASCIQCDLLADLRTAMTA